MRGSIKGQRHSSWNICWVVDGPQGQGGIRDSSQSETNTPFFCVFALRIAISFWSVAIPISLVCNFVDSSRLSYQS